MKKFRLATVTAAALLLGAPSLKAIPLVTVGDTQMNLYGWVWVYGHYYQDAKEEQSGYAGSLFYNYNGTGPLDTHTLPDHQYVMAVQPTRFGFLSNTPNTSLGNITTQIEYDLNGSNSHLRQAALVIGDWTFGQNWSLWGDRDLWYETADWLGPLGQPAWLLPHVLEIQYYHKIDAKNSGGISLEQQTTTNAGAVGSSSTSTGDVSIPTVIAAWTYKDKWGHLCLHGMGQYFGTFVPGTSHVSKKNYGRMEYAYMVSGDFRLSKSDDFLYDFYKGNALGGYGIGYQSVVFNDANRSVTPFQSIGWAAGLSHTWSPKYRSNISVGGVQYARPSLPASMMVYFYLKSGISAFANTFIFFNKYVDMGIEYGIEQARAASGYTAMNDNGQPASHNTNAKVNVSLRGRF